MSKKRIEIIRGREGLILSIPFELLTEMLKPRVVFSTVTKLTKREQQVYEGIMKAQSNKEIADTLNLTERTVKFHVSGLLEKYGVRSRNELQVARVNEEGA